jgi:hypothetical protein
MLKEDGGASVKRMIQAWKVSAADIANNNYNLDIKNPNAPVEVHDDPEELFNLYLEIAQVLVKKQSWSEIKMA